VTKDNFEQPWLLFEAGALSKSLDTSYVVPLLFNLEQSDLTDSPLLQFQATSFSKDEIKKLIDTINNASKNKLDAYELDEAFNVWYPQLEKSLQGIADSNESDPAKVDVSEKSSLVLEEILALSRENQKLLRNPESFHSDELKMFSDKLERLYSIIERNDEYRRKRRMHPAMIEEMLHFSKKEMGGNYGMLVALSLLRDDFPWIYDLGKELFDVLKSNKSAKVKEVAIREFKEVIEHTMRLPMRISNRKDDMMMSRDFLMMFMELIDREFYATLQSSEG